MTDEEYKKAELLYPKVKEYLKILEKQAGSLTNLDIENERVEKEMDLLTTLFPGRVIGDTILYRFRFLLLQLDRHLRIPPTPNERSFSIGMPSSGGILYSVRSITYYIVFEGIDFLNSGTGGGDLFQEFVRVQEKEKIELIIVPMNKSGYVDYLCIIKDRVLKDENFIKRIIIGDPRASLGNIISRTLYEFYKSLGTYEK